MNNKYFWRSVAVTSVILFCFILLFKGTSLAYENTRQLGYSDYRPALEISENHIRIFDFNIDF